MLRILCKVALSFAVSLALPLLVCAQDGLLPASAQEPSQQASAPPATSPIPEKLLVNYVEAGGSYESLSSGFGHWDGGYMRTVIVTGKNTWNGEINGQEEFGDSGVYMAAGDTYNFNSSWYGALTVGSSAGGFFWPKWRADAFLNRKWSERQQFITTLGFGYYAAKDVHRDRSFFAGSTYYFSKPWIIEEGIRFNLSNPGKVFSPAGFVAITQGRDKHHYVTLNAGFGEEAYQIVGVASVLTRFQSQTATLTWRQWIGKKWGINFVADYYHSPFYHRDGGSLGIFREF
ncbi:MAG TPA: YaiO family outer membrane beta-barrel protein [Candidatus Acidoferrales bacterium]|nr:YaiO family outer membrane beta-barrel protein [Candidatus Acidoferrales bacterium]